MHSSTSSRKERNNTTPAPILADHEKPYIINTGGVGMDEYKVVSTPGLEKVSGVTDSSASGANGKLMVATMFRDPTMNARRAHKMLQRLNSLPRNAKIYCERTGTGHCFYRAKYRCKDETTGRSKLVSIYLGSRNNEVLRWVAACMYEQQLMANTRAMLHPDRFPAPDESAPTMIWERPIIHQRKKRRVKAKKKRNLTATLLPGSDDPS